GNNNLAMLQTTIPGWKVETVGDDIAWMRFGEDCRLYAINPEDGFFGVAPGTGEDTNANAVKTFYGNSIFTNVALTDDGDVWWEGLTEEPPAHLTDWRGNSWTPESPTPAAHPNARFTVPASQCPIIAPEWEDPAGVPISAILFGGRRASAVPLVTESFDWQHGVFLGANVASEKTAAAEGTVGELRRDPFAMLPFCGYNMGDYFAHWVKLGQQADAAKLPKIYYVNWFRKNADGKFVWPGFGENSRVLKWAIERIEHKADGKTTPIGIVPTASDLDLEGLDVDAADVDEALAVNAAEWRDELPLIEDWFEFVGEKLPTGLKDEFDALKHRLAEAD
ncbi:MAG: phosphoenolpyruvate carboxykinase, partial [Mycobacterium sp.]|nr:phosphoenolpyruvate carboxykinase [Mycobacterium sp.]